MNQDAYRVLNEEGVWLLADGMGGHPGGDVAADLAAASVAASFAAWHRAATPTDERAVRIAISEANAAIQQRARECPTLSGMGTTLVVAVIPPNQDIEAWIGHVGDSRAYRYRAGHLSLLTSDHTVVEEAVRARRMTPAEAKRHPYRHVLSRAVGIEPQVEPDIARHSVHPRDRILLCSDGLTKMLGDDAIADLLAASRSAPDACEALIAEANRRGGEDNTTVIVIAHD
jgi:protein phosphatase